MRIHEKLEPVVSDLDSRKEVFVAERDRYYVWHVKTPEGWQARRIEKPSVNAPRTAS